MSVKIRLAVTGKTNQISYRIVASDTHSKRDGKFLEILGFYNPTSNAAEKLRIDKDRLDAWIKKGALLTPAVALLIEKGTLERPKKPKAKPVEEAAQTAPTEPQAEAPSEIQTEPETPSPVILGNETTPESNEADSGQAGMTNKEIASSQAPRNDNEVGSDKSDQPKEDPVA